VRVVEQPNPHASPTPSPEHTLQASPFYLWPTALGKSKPC